MRCGKCRRNTVPRQRESGVCEDVCTYCNIIVSSVYMSPERAALLKNAAASLEAAEKIFVKGKNNGRHT